MSGQLPVYTDEVGTARADNRLGLPLGAAYLREASTLLRGTLLPAASDIYTRESALLTSASAQATGLPLLVVAVVAGLGLGYVLFRSSRWLSRHTHRVVNYGLLLAALAGLVSLVWLAGAFVVGRADLLHAQQQGSAPAQAFARAEVAALQAHADESLTLIDNSGDDSYQKDYLAQQKLLGPGPGTLLAAVQAAASGAGPTSRRRPGPGTRRTRRCARKDDAGNHAAAVQSALSGDAATQFRAAVRDPQRRGSTTHQAVFASSARSGRDAFTGLAVGHDRGVAGDGGRLRLGPEPSARGVPVNARPRPAPWRRALAGGARGVRAGAGRRGGRRRARPAARRPRRPSAARAATARPPRSHVRPDGEQPAPVRAAAGDARARSWRRSAPAATSSPGWTRAPTTSASSTRSPGRSRASTST